MMPSLQNSVYYHNNVLYPPSTNYTKFYNLTDNDGIKDNFIFIPRNETKFYQPIKHVTSKNKFIVTNDRIRKKSIDRKHEDHHSGHSSGHSSGHDHHEHHDHHDYHTEKHKYKRCGHKGKHGHKDDKKKYLLPAMVGLLTAKAIILPLILKFIAFLSAKGLFLGLVATIMSSILSLKKLLEPSYKLEGKKDDVTKIEVVRVPFHDKINHFPHTDFLDDKVDNSYNPYQGYYN